MTKHLIIKTTSLGDVVHMLPAISDAVRQFPNCSFDWMVERGFDEVPAWHPHVNRTIPVEVRKWRKKLFKKKTWQEISAFKQLVKQRDYTKVIDSQGLLKSAVLGLVAKGARWGYDKKSIREPLARLFYQHTVSVPFKEHAVTRNRLILAKSLGYDIDQLPLDYGIAGNEVFALAFNALQSEIGLPNNYIVALHGTSSSDKCWPVNHWHDFISEMECDGYSVLLPWGNSEEHTRAALLANEHNNAVLLPKCSLTTLAGLLEKSSAVIGMDTGLMHLAAAFDKKGVALYPVTQTELTGVMSASGGVESISGKASLDVQSVIGKMRALLSLSSN